ncbi:GNAT family N-acetyltransferase [Kribbella sp.]|uniref:GNAT family N-acetyltransferase n=1 Tax=Kribbella sp. TaxID=1871183 RepID=UPI002D420B38|nr:GNAT family N-acetyltransferase [Kribbella sp.]HZX01389.1 GNAT family N-acetyltransferase [Kribbella sp.]
MDRIPAGWLVLRPFTSADVEWVYDVSQDPALRQFVQVPSPYLMEHARYFVEELAIASEARAEFVVEDAATGERLARVGLGLRGDGTAEVGYWTAPAARGRGVAPAAVRALCRWGFDVRGLELIEWRAEVGNFASRRVAEKAGFVLEGQLRKRLVHRGQRVDAWIGSLVRGEVP